MAAVHAHHLGFGTDDLPSPGPTFAFLSGDPDRAEAIALAHLHEPWPLSRNRGLVSYLGSLEGTPVLSCTSGMGGPSTSIVVNELAQLGIRTIVRVGTTGSIQPHVAPGTVVVSQAALCRQGAARDLAPAEFPAAADPFLTVTLAEAAATIGVPHVVGVTASVDTFFEGQERTATSFNPMLLRRNVGMTEEYRALRIVNFEMEAGLLFTQSLIYGLAAGAVLAVIAQRTESERIVGADEAEAAVQAAIAVAVEGARRWLAR
ncbi:MAG: nucleoside phosphorylase [Acidimicrobiales bacterium]